MIDKINWHDGFTLAYLKDKSQNTMVSHLDIEFTEIGDHYLIAKMPVDEELNNLMALCMAAHPVFWQNPLAALLLMPASILRKITA